MIIEWILDGGWVLVVILLGLAFSLLGCWLTRKNKHSEFFGCDACEGSYDEENEK